MTRDQAFAEVDAPSDALSRGPAAVELGFAEPEETPPEGISGAASFSWARDPAEVRAVCSANVDRLVVVDEYGRTMTGGQFLSMLRCNCPIEFTDSVGREFS